MRNRARLTVLAMAMALGACSQPATDASPPPAPPSTAVASPAPSAPAGQVVLPEVDQSDPDSVADAVAVALTAHDARTDATSQETWARAEPWLTGGLAATAHSAGGSELARPDNRWAMMRQKQAWDVVESIDRSIDDPVPDTETTALRQRAVSVRAYNQDGWSGLVQTSRYWLRLTKVDGAWKVEQMTSTVD